MTDGEALEVRLLGPLELVHEGRRIALGGPRLCGLLTLLAVEANEVVSRDRLVDGLWGARAPGLTGNALAVLVARLRSVLPAGVIETVRSGYRLCIPHGATDVHRFEQLLEASAGASPID